MEYVRRIIDDQLSEMMAVLPAISVEGAKGVGKTATATRRTQNVFSLDDEATEQIIAGNPKLVDSGEPTTFVDEWQLVPTVWNVVRRAVDDGAAPGSFLLAGSASPSPQVRIHSGAGRIVRLTMRPQSLPERGLVSTTVSLRDLLSCEPGDLGGATSMDAADYVHEILASGFPGIRAALAEARPHLLQSYVDRIIDHDVDQLGQRSRRSESVRGWLTAYAAATSTAASYSSILRAATPGETDKPSKVTAMAYRDVLQRLWVLDPIAAWTPSFGHLKRLALAPKHHLVDPALAAVLVGASAASLIRGDGPSGGGRDGTFLGALFESLAAQTVRVLAQASGAAVFHFRTHGGEREVDLIVQRPDHRVLAMEVKLSATVRPDDVSSLNWLEVQAPDLVKDKLILNTGTRAYRRPDGVGVIPLSLLGV